MKYCHQCGHNLTLGIEKFCPSCGTGFQQDAVLEIDGKHDKNISVNIQDTKGDQIGIGVSGTRNIIGKDFIVQNFILNYSGSNPNEVKEIINNISTVSTQLVSNISQGTTTATATEDIRIKSEEASTAKQQITTILNEVNTIEKKEGTQIQEIKVGDLQISRTELVLIEYLLKGNEHYYKKEYAKAIDWYDKALKIDPNNVFALYSKGVALKNLGKIEEAIEGFDKILKIDPNNVEALVIKGLGLANLRRHEEAIQVYDKASEDRSK